LDIESSCSIVPNRNGHHREKVGQLYAETLVIFVQDKGNYRQFKIFEDPYGNYEFLGQIASKITKTYILRIETLIPIFPSFLFNSQNGKEITLYSYF